MSKKSNSLSYVKFQGHDNPIQKWKSSSHLEYSEVKDDHDDAWNVEWSYGWIDDKLWIVEGIDKILLTGIHTPSGVILHCTIVASHQHSLSRILWAFTRRSWHTRSGHELNMILLAFYNQGSMRWKKLYYKRTIMVCASCYIVAFL